jgi:large-conductance mechanosensitive channel
MELVSGIGYISGARDLYFIYVGVRSHLETIITIIIITQITFLLICVITQHPKGKLKSKQKKNRTNTYTQRKDKIR